MYPQLLFFSPPLIEHQEKMFLSLQMKICVVQIFMKIKPTLSRGNNREISQISFLIKLSFVYISLGYDGLGYLR